MKIDLILSLVMIGTTAKKKIEIVVLVMKLIRKKGCHRSLSSSGAETVVAASNLAECTGALPIASRLCGA